VSNTTQALLSHATPTPSTSLRPTFEQVLSRLLAMRRQLGGRTLPLRHDSSAGDQASGNEGGGRGGSGHGGSGHAGSGRAGSGDGGGSAGAVAPSNQHPSWRQVLRRYAGGEVRSPPPPPSQQQQLQSSRSQQSQGSFSHSGGGVMPMFPGASWSREGSPGQMRHAGALSQGMDGSRTSGEIIVDLDKLGLVSKGRGWVGGPFFDREIPPSGVKFGIKQSSLSWPHRLICQDLPRCIPA
jgi:hypothetical protein